MRAESGWPGERSARRRKRSPCNERSSACSAASCAASSSLVLVRGPEGPLRSSSETELAGEVSSL